MATDNRIGNNLNTWREPVFTLAANEGWLESTILSHDKLKKINIISTQWTEFCHPAATLIDYFVSGIKKYATDYEGLIIYHDYVKQGSCREGLKVNSALEFDCLLIFEILGMKIEEDYVLDKNGQKILGLVKLKVTNGEYLCRTYPWLDRLGILKDLGHYTYEFYFNTKNMYEKVLKSIVDKTRSDIQLSEKQPASDKRVRLKVSACPPSFNIKITIDKVPSFKLNIDIVPAIILRLDTVPDPYTVRSPTGVSQLECPVFAVMKWANNIRESSRIADNEYLWRESACGYEKHILDICRRNQSQRYLMTACRIVKSYVDWLKENKPQEDQLPRVAVSYYLKNICFHCIALLTIPSETNTLSGVQEALGYFLCFLGLCIENQNLPHFFYGNPWLSVMFPNCSFLRIGGMKKNLYHPDSIKKDTFRQAKLGFKNMLHNLKGYYTEFDQLDKDRVGLFKELLGLQHIYTRKKHVLEQRSDPDQRPFPARWTSLCRFYMFLLVILVADALIAYSAWVCFM